MDSIDDAAYQFHITKDKKYFDVFIKHVTPIIRQMVYKSCAGSSWDTDELFSILLADMWRLFNRWEFDEGKKFHWLVLRQLKNKIINYIHQVRGRPHRVCNTCGTKQNKNNNMTPECIKCGISLRLPDIIVSNTFEAAYNAHNPNYLEDIANKQLVNKLLARVKDEDHKTYRILQLMLAGCSKSEISREIKLAQNAMNNRIKKCRKIIDNLVKEKNCG